MTDTPVSDSYLETIEAADAILATRLDAASWTAASSADKAKALQMATASIDSQTYTGLKYLSTQARQFPRKYAGDPNDVEDPWGGVINYDSYGYIYESTDVPDDVLLACALEALALIDYYSSSSTSPIDEADLIAKGVKSFSLGKLSMSFGGSFALQSGFRSKEAFDLLDKYIECSVLIT